jgi:O-antigen ligase
LSCKSVSKYQRGLIGFFLFAGVATSLISFVLVNTKNGIGAFIILLSVWVFVYFIQSVKLKKYFMPLAILIMIIGIAGYGVHKHLKLNQQWNTFLEDIEIGYQVDKYSHWQDHARGFPNNSTGIVSHSTYERTAWATASLRYLIQNPLGAGVLGDSLKRMAAKNGVESNSLRFSHSGWIDLTLAIGIPGFLLILLSMLSSFYWALKSCTEVASVSIWWLLAIALYWLIAELATNKHFIEMLIFMLVFVGAVNSFSANESNSKNKLGELN